MKKITFLLLFVSSIFTISKAQNFGLLIDGVEEQLVVPHKDVFNISTAFTIEAWIYANSWQPNIWQGSIVNKDIPGPDRGYGFRCGDNGKLSFVMAADNTWNEVFTSSIMNSEQWHHVAVVVSGTNMTLYIDGQAVATESYTGTISSNTEDLTIGASTGFGDRHFDGVLDEIRIWNVARTQTELADNSSTVFTGNEAGLVAYFPMNDGSGTTAENLVDAACSATLSNMDDSNWVEGFAIPDYDISVQPISGIDVFNMKYRPILMNTNLSNLGNENLTDVEVTISVNGSEVVTETIATPIPSGSLFNYQFITPIDLTDLDNPTIEISAYHPDDQNTLNNVKDITLSTQTGNIIRLFDGKQHNFGSAGQNHFNNVVLPASLEEFEQLLLHINLSCPSGGCDPWDQPAKVNAITDEGNFEIARYVTPYGIACGPWTVDVTDFKSILTGSVSFHSYVQVWGGNGWLVTIDLELIEGNDSYPFYNLHSLWETDYQVYGDPSFSYDLAEQNIAVDAITEASHIRMTMSGHGQGNTDNAAEFSNMTHQFLVDGTSVNDHNLWKADCAENDCADQAGSWLFARAGWCPGQAVDPYIVNTTTNVSAGSTVAIDYELEAYTNLLNTGYNETSHTEPHYRIWSYFVEQSSQRYVDYSNLLTTAITPTIGAGDSFDGLTLDITNNGSVAMSNFELSYFINNELIATETVAGPLAPNESMTHNFTTIDGYQAGFQNIFYGVVSHPDDENLGDNVIDYLIDGMVAVDEIEQALTSIKVYPNPVQYEFNIELDPILKGSTLDILTSDGRLVKRTIATNQLLNINIKDAGVYFIHLTHPDGYVVNKKIVVL